MPRHAFLIEYDGLPFAGWQRQEGQASVQGALEAALARLDPAAPGVTGAGRTDTGVHATAQVAHADLSREWAPFRLAEALNAHLRPLPVAVLAVAAVPDSFHARFSAVERRYRYRILNRRAPPALDAGRVWHVKGALDAGAMAWAAAMLVGRHDFTTFRSSMCQAQSPVKTLDEATVRREGDEVVLEFRARSFLHNQVRSMVGSLERVGAGGWPVGRVGEALAARSRAACGPVAPPQGLCLMGVGYPEDPFGRVGRGFPDVPMGTL
jgi:tRNA pseudouridine38-40 synthase